MDKLERLIKDVQDPNSQYNRRKRFEQNVKRNQKAFDRYKSEQQSKKDDEEEELPVEILKPSEKIILRKKKELGGKFASTEWYRNAMTSELKEVQEDYDFSHLDDTFGFDEGHFYFFDYDALHPNRYPYWDQHPFAKILEIDVNFETAMVYILGANIHYLTPEGGYRGKVAVSALNSMNSVPEVCLHTYVLSGITNPLRVPDDDVEGLSNFITESFVDKMGKRVSPNKVWRS